MSDVPSYVWPFILAVIAAVSAFVVTGGKARDDSGSLPGWILYALALGCVVIGIATWFLSNRV